MLAWIAGGALLALFVAACGWWYATSNVETPPYETVRADEGAGIEVRDYPALLAAEVTREGGRDAAVRAGFGPLAGYIFAKERSGEKIAMTAPVTQARDDGAWTIRFIMPQGYDRETLPVPAGEDVEIVEVPARRVAAIRFSGVQTDALLAEREAVLREWLAANDLPSDGAATFAYYNDPFTPGFLRRNEVLVALD